MCSGYNHCKFLPAAFKIQTKIVIAFLRITNMLHVFGHNPLHTFLARSLRFFFCFQLQPYFEPHPIQSDLDSQLDFCGNCCCFLRLIAACELFNVFIASGIQSRYLYNLFQQLVLFAFELYNLVATGLQIIITHTTRYRYGCALFTA